MLTFAIITSNSCFPVLIFLLLYYHPFVEFHLQTLTWLSLMLPFSKLWSSGRSQPAGGSSHPSSLKALCMTSSCLLREHSSQCRPRRTSSLQHTTINQLKCFTILKSIHYVFNLLKTSFTFNNKIKFL